MISAAHEDDRSVAADGPTAPGPAAPVTPVTPVVVRVPVARRAVEDSQGSQAAPTAPTARTGPVAEQAPQLDTVPPSAFRVAGPDEDARAHLDRVAADLESQATTVTWALRIALLGLVGLVVLLLAVL